VHHVRKSRRIVSESCLVAEGIRKSGHREVLGVAMGNGESEQGWREFFLSLRKRGLQGVDLVVSDDHVGWCPRR
jgi:transposase-like protein